MRSISTDQRSVLLFYQYVLVALCYVDIWLCVSGILATDCEQRTFLNTTARLSTLWNLINGVQLKSGMIVIFLVHCLAAVERYRGV